MADVQGLCVSLRRKCGFFVLLINRLNGYKMRIFLRRLSVFSIVMFASACSSVQQSDGGGRSYSESGMASFYGDEYVNRQTASGERYQHDLKTAAHKTLPFGSVVRVTSSDNGKSVVVKINDRGPFVKGRIIDLSKSAFNAIGNSTSGLIHVDIEVIP